MQHLLNQEHVIMEKLLCQRRVNSNVNSNTDINVGVDDNINVGVDDNIDVD